MRLTVVNLLLIALLVPNIPRTEEARTLEKPELFQFVYEDEAGRFNPLAASVATLSQKGLFKRSKFSYEVAGEKCTVRLANNRIPRFAVKLRDDQHPREYVQFVKLKSAKGKRVMAAPTPKKKSPNELPFSHERRDGVVYLGVGRLDPGEYAFSVSINNEAFCFGVDPPEVN